MTKQLDGLQEPWFALPSSCDWFRLLAALNLVFSAEASEDKSLSKDKAYLRYLFSLFSTFSKLAFKLQPTPRVWD